MSSYKLAPEARRDLIEIANYLADRDPDAAERVLKALLDAAERLDAKPAIGHRRPDLTDRDVRFWPVLRRYVLAYRNATSPIEIVRVFGPGRDIATLLL